MFDSLLRSVVLTTAGIIGGYPTTCMAHVGGFVAGILMANALILLRVADCGETDLALVQILRPSLVIAGAAGAPRTAARRAN